jgi:hypothetical protein
MIHDMSSTTVSVRIDPASKKRLEKQGRSTGRSRGHELVARLTSLLWRLRRSTVIESNLFQLQGQLAM